MRQVLHRMGICLLLVGVGSSAQAAFHLWQIQEVYTNSDGSVQFIEMHDNNAGETSTNGFKLTATSDGSSKSITLTNLGHSTPGSLLFATSGFASLAGGVTPDFTLPSTQFFNPSATSITISFNGSGDSITFSGASLPHDGIHSLTDTNLYSTPNLVSGVNSPMNLLGNSGSVNLSTPSPTGDYNGNHVVDAADYVLWRNTLGQTVTAGHGADGNADGTINAADYNFWRSKFGNTAGSGSGLESATSAPEPAAASLVVTALLLSRLRRQRSP